MAQRSNITIISSAAIAVCLTATTTAAKPTRQEAANLKIVQALVSGLADPHPDAAGLAELFSEDASVSFSEYEESARGRQQVETKIATLFADGTRYQIKVHASRALGPVVINARDDIAINAAGSSTVFKVTGVFVIIGGKIRSWKDY